jgi:hypothetical protein
MPARRDLRAALDLLAEDLEFEPFLLGGGKFGLGAWMEPQNLAAVTLFEHGDGNDLRNRLAHEYPLDRARQTLLVNDAFAAIAPLLETLARTEAYVRTRLPEVAAIPTPRNVP